MATTQLKVGTRKVWMHKAIVHPNFEAESVLSNDPWLFVELWLKRQGAADALAYWMQARRFTDAAKTMPIEAASLPLYYSFLNATKTLLVVRSAKHGGHHGVSGDRGEFAKTSLSNEMITFHGGGVLPALCSYLGESAVSQQYSLKDLLWNMPFVHRAFRHTFTSSPELFIPIEHACYVMHPTTNEAWFQALVVPRYADGRTLRGMTASFEAFDVESGQTYIRRKKRFKWCRGRPTSSEKEAAQKRLATYHASARRLVVPISGNRDLWYLKKSAADNPVAERHGLTIVFAAMHRFSELSRYDPRGLERHLSGQANWLISEFIEHASDQFIDQIASEITGLAFWRPQIRS